MQYQAILAVIFHGQDSVNEFMIVAAVLIRALPLGENILKPRSISTGLELELQSVMVGGQS